MLGRIVFGLWLKLSISPKRKSWSVVYLISN
nr:MAG TPA: hypothetical protein [Bacteriophage sp.]